MKNNSKESNHFNFVKQIFGGFILLIYLVLAVFGFGRSDNSSQEEEQEQHENQNENKSKQTKRGGFGQAARRRSSWGTG